MILRKFFVASLIVVMQMTSIYADSLSSNTLADELVDRIAKIVSKEKLTPMSLDCLIFVSPYFRAGKYTISVREKHNKKCGGDPGTGPMVFWAGIDQVSGQVWKSSYDTSFKWRKIKGEVFSNIKKLRSGIGSNVNHGLYKTKLYKKSTNNCKRVNLKFWSHPTKNILKKNNVTLKWLELCNDKKYPIFGVNFKNDPKNVYDVSIENFYNDMYIKNGKWPLSIVATNNKTVISISKDKGEKIIEYEVFSE